MLKITQNKLIFDFYGVVHVVIKFKDTLWIVLIIPYLDHIIIKNYRNTVESL